MSIAMAGALLALLPSGAGHAASGSPDTLSRLVDAITAKQDPRVAAAVARIDGTDRRLLALRAYLRAGTGLAARWSWTDQQIAAFGQSAESRAMQAEIEQVRAAFALANPGFELWVNPEVRSLDTQLVNWNRNESVARAAAGLQSAVVAMLRTRAVSAGSASAKRAAVEKFLVAYIPSPTPTIAAPGLSPHGQMRAVDFQVQKDDQIVAGPDTSTIDARWDAAGWTTRLQSAVRAGSMRFTGPLQVPREPWHYTYTLEAE